MHLWSGYALLLQQREEVAIPFLQQALIGGRPGNTDVFSIWPVRMRSSETTGGPARVGGGQSALAICDGERLATDYLRPPGVARASIQDAGRAHQGGITTGRPA